MRPDRSPLSDSALAPVHAANDNGRRPVRPAPLPLIAQVILAFMLGAATICMVMAAMMLGAI